jgi:Asp-tRNA(Asn)/Glu-tRNA(Gln) amidotransferase A subunit family amidase
LRPPDSELGWPALSVPIGSDDGTPFGLQLVGRPFDEQRLLSVAAVIEPLLPWSERRPAEPIGRRA